MHGLCNFNRVSSASTGSRGQSLLPPIPVVRGGVINKGQELRYQSALKKLAKVKFLTETDNLLERLIMGIPHASVLVLPLFFSSLVLSPALSASAEQASPSLQPNYPSSIKITLSKQAPSAIRLEAKRAPLAQILKELTDKTGVKIHYSALPSDLVTVTCTEVSVKTVVECLLGSGANLASKMPEKIGKATQPLHPDAKVAELWILSAPTVVSHADTPIAEAIEGQPSKPLQQKSKNPDVAERDRDQFDETLKQTTSKNPEERATALYNLGLSGKTDDPDIKDALKQALTDKNANVREQAVASITQTGDQDLIAELNQQPKAGKDADRITDEDELFQDVAMLQKAAKGGEKMALEFIKNRLPDSKVEQ